MLKQGEYLAIKIINIGIFLDLRLRRSQQKVVLGSFKVHKVISNILHKILVIQVIRRAQILSGDIIPTTSITIWCKKERPKQKSHNSEIKECIKSPDAQNRLPKNTPKFDKMLLLFSSVWTFIFMPIVVLLLSSVRFEYVAHIQKFALFYACHSSSFVLDMNLRGCY